MSYPATIVIRNTYVAPHTGQFTACEFNYTNIPGLGRALVNAFSVVADIKIVMLALTDPGDHGGRIWTGQAAWELAQGLAFRYISSATILNAGSAPTPSFDVSGTNGRIRVIPTFSGGTWITTMTLNIYQL